MKAEITQEEVERLVTLKSYAQTLSDLIEELAGEADVILGDSGVNSFGDDLMWNSHGETVPEWLDKNAVKVNG